MTPEETQSYLEGVKKRYDSALKLEVAVGLPKDKISGKAYGSGSSVVQVGAAHEYGTGNVPQRSFLREPFLIKRRELQKTIDTVFSRIFEGMDTEKGLSIIGTQAMNISKKAFTSGGYGAWAPLDPATVKAKGSSQILIDTGMLRSSITYVVRPSNG